MSKQVFDGVLDYSGTNLGTTNWVPIGVTLTLNVRKLKIFETTNSEIEIGYGAPGQSGPAYVAQRAFRMIPGGGDYDQIFNTNMQIFARLIQLPDGTTGPLTTGRLVINGFY